MVLELATRLKENYMVLLPETIPFLAELMEGKTFKAQCLCNLIRLGTWNWLTQLLCFDLLDECEEVEHQVQKVINEMETILGEPLQSYF